MKKVWMTLGVAAVLFTVTSCGNNDKPKTDLDEQEQASVDSLINSDQAKMDSLESAIKAEIGEDSAAAEK